MNTLSLCAWFLLEVAQWSNLLTKPLCYPILSCSCSRYAAAQNRDYISQHPCI